MKKQVFPFSILLFLALCIGSPLLSAGPANQNDNTPPVIVSGGLQFQLPGYPGEFPAIQPVIIKVKKGYCVQITIGKLTYTGEDGKDDQFLDALYWINDPDNLIIPETPFRLDAGNPGKIRPGADYLEARLYGKVIVRKVSAQPAGNYAGRVSLVVTKSRM